MIDNIQEICMASNTSVMDAMHIIDKGGAQIALVLDVEGRLIGTVTDGDIRRALLHGANLDSPVKELMNLEYRFVHNNTDKAEVLQMMRQELLRQVPVLDTQGRVEEIILLQEMLSPPKYEESVVIMAGGQGSRLRPYTEDCPKPMLPVDNKPILEILLEQCIESGFSKFYFSVNYLKEQIIEYFGDGAQWGVTINYLIEEQPLGTAGSLKLLPDSIESPILVINGDVLTQLNLSQLLNFHNEHNAKATMCVRQHELTVPFGVVKTKGTELLNFEEKPTYRNLVNAGVYVIDPELLTLLPSNEFTDMPYLLQAGQKKGYKVNVCPIHEYWIDVGMPDSLKSARQKWGKGAKT